MRRVMVVALLAACGDNLHGAPVDAPPDAPSSDRFATGHRILDHSAGVGGITSDGFVAYYDFDDAGHGVAKVQPIAGGAETVIATSVGTGKQDVRFEIWGDLVFAWTDRGNRVSTLTLWSAATGPIARGDNIRPGRAAATSDGHILYERDVTATTANLAIGTIAGPDTMVGVANSADADCWQDTDFARVADRMLVRFCPDGATAFTLRSVAATGAMQDLSIDATEASYTDARAVWLESSGTLAATADGVTVAKLTTVASDFTTTNDGIFAAFTTANGTIFGMPTDNTEAPRVMVAPGSAVQLGALSPDGQSVLYATQSVMRDPNDVAPYTDVVAAVPLAEPYPLVSGTTSCTDCLYDSFTADGHYALVIDPIDNSEQVDREGPIEVYALADGRQVTSFGSLIYTAIGLPDDRFAFIDAVRSDVATTGWYYGMTLRSIDSTADVIAHGAEDFAFDHDLTTVVLSFDGADSLSGLWVVSLQ